MIVPSISRGDAVEANRLMIEYFLLLRRTRGFRVGYGSALTAALVRIGNPKSLVALRLAFELSLSRPDPVGSSLGTLGVYLNGLRRFSTRESVLEMLACMRTLRAVYMDREDGEDHAATIALIEQLRDDALSSLDTGASDDVVVWLEALREAAASPGMTEEDRLHLEKASARLTRELVSIREREARYRR